MFEVFGNSLAALTPSTWVLSTAAWPFVAVLIQRDKRGLQEKGRGAPDGVATTAARSASLHPCQHRFSSPEGGSDHLNPEISPSLSPWSLTCPLAPAARRRVTSRAFLVRDILGNSLLLLKERRSGEEPTEKEKKGKWSRAAATSSEREKFQLPPRSSLSPKTSPPQPHSPRSPRSFHKKIFRSPVWCPLFLFLLAVGGRGRGRARGHPSPRLVAPEAFRAGRGSKERFFPALFCHLLHFSPCFFAFLLQIPRPPPASPPPSLFSLFSPSAPPRDLGSLALYAMSYRSRALA